MEVEHLVIADTDFLSLYLKGDNLTRVHIEDMISQGYFFTTTSISSSELLFGAYKKGWKRTKIKQLIDFLTKIGVLDFNFKHSQIYGELRANLSKKGLEIGFADTAIASICIGADVPLLTYNIKHFKDIDKLQLFRDL